jgi:hypothetical protein
LAKDCKNKTQQGNPKKERTPQANIIDVDHLGNEVLKMNLIFYFFCFRCQPNQQFQVVMSLYLCNKTFMHEEYNVFHLQISGW